MMRQMRIWWLGVLLVAACAPNSGNGDGAFSLATPQDSLAYYIDSLRRGSVMGVKTATIYADFYLPGPIAIDSYEIVREEVLTEATAAEYGFRPQPLAGDVEFDVRQIRDGRDSMYTYHLRQYGDAWRIYAHFAWDAP